jgi:hypothetical protein
MWAGARSRSGSSPAPASTPGRQQATRLHRDPPHTHHPRERRRRIHPNRATRTSKIELVTTSRLLAPKSNYPGALDDDAARTIAETRRYLDDADELLRTETTAVEFFDAMVERYPSHLGQTVLWAGASAVYGVREHPEEDVTQILFAGWL